MDEFVPAPESKRLFDLRRLEPGDPLGIRGIIGDKSTRDLAAPRRQDAHRIAAAESTLDALDTGWQQALAFLAEGDTLTCVIASETLFNKVLAVVGRRAG